MHVVTESRRHQPSRPDQPDPGPRGHQWVGAAVVGLGQGESPRAEHAHRTGRHVLRQATRIEVLEVYCHRCRLRFSAAADRVPCTTLMARAG